MKSFNVICGLPRSGSTLLCNVLNQNPEIYASSTSIVPVLINSITNLITNSAEVKGAYIRNANETQNLIDRTLRGIINNWYQDRNARLRKSHESQTKFIWQR